MDELKILLSETASTDWDTGLALRKLSPEIHAAAEQIRRKRRERLQLLAFLLCALALLAAFALVLREYRQLGQLGQLSKHILIALAAGVGLTLLLAPVLTYFAEEGKNYEEA